MKTLLIAILLTAPLALSAQVCNHVVYPHVVVGGTGSFIITSDVTMPYNDGSTFYVCSGVHLTIEGSAGCNYQLEDGAILTILDHDGDNVVAKGNCTITDMSSSTTLVVTGESTTTISKPNDPTGYVFMLCQDMVFDYQLVRGSAPCGSLNLNEEMTESLEMYPNPVVQEQMLNFNEVVTSVSLTDLSGRLVMNEAALNSDELSIEGLKTGFYIVTIQRENGTIATSRLQVK